MEKDEIVIGIDDKKENKQKDNKKKKARKKTTENKKGGSLKIIAIIILILISIVLLFSSSIFNIQKIDVVGNEKLSSEKISSLSSLQLYTNIFKFNKNNIIDNLKENAYIESATISRKLPSTVEIKVKERAINYILQFADSYVYINNQGYMLEITNEKKDVPILIGFTTDLSNIKPGNRINSEDLNKMNKIIKIYENLKLNGLGDKVTKIDISNEKNYTLLLEPEGKTVYLGDASNLNTRILCLQAILEQSAGKSGEIFLDVDLNTQRGYFRENMN